MKHLKLFSLFILVVGFFSCSDDDTPNNTTTEVRTVSNLYAPQQGGQGQPVSGEFTKFDFEAGIQTESSTEWDVAFRGTTILINGGENAGITDEPNRTGNAAAYIENDVFANVTSINSANFKQDSSESLAIPTGSGNGWYTYNPQNNTINPTPGKVLVIRTRSGQYAKFEILSYYKDAPEEITPEIAANDLRYYTFNYVVQSNEAELEF